MAYGNDSGGPKKAPVIASNLEEVSRKAESISYVDEFIKNEATFLPDVDFYNPASFAKFGSAEQYYVRAIQNIYQFYPYDGSEKEKLEWLNNCTYLDRHVFEKEYPRTNGNIEIGETWGTVSATKTISGDQYKLSDAPQYIFIKGGPHGPTTPTYATSSYGKALSFKELEQKANVFNEARNQKQNLTINGGNGNTVEFWLKYPTNPFSDQQSRTFSYFDLWNGQTVDSVDPGSEYGRITIQTKIHRTLDEFPEQALFLINYRSGSSGVDAAKLGSLSSNTFSSPASDFNIDPSNWNHYAFSFENNPTGSDHLLLKLYINGNLIETVHTGSQIGEVKAGPFNAALGAYRTGPNQAEITAGVTEGYGSISASFDEFRFWTIAQKSDSIKFNWFKQIHGGTNTDYGDFTFKFTGSYSPVNLGVYYKFNEGITGQSANDRIALDYSGRVSNGFIKNYSSGMRSTGSAIVEGGAATTEFKDPIIYDFHPLVATYLEESIYKGREYDQTNGMNLYNTLPTWIMEADDNFSSDTSFGSIQALTQIIASQFDDIYLKTEALPSLKNKKYLSGSVSGSMNKPLPFADRLLTSKGFPAPEIFSNANVYEALANRNDEYEFQKSLQDVKNQIYTNLYNNLSYINKSKGTEKSIQAILNCFGVGENVYSINFYANNSKLNLNRSAVSKTIQKKYADFDHIERRSATIFQMTSSTDSNSVSFITASNTTMELPFTVEAEIIFPKKPSRDEPAFSDRVYTNQSSSLFGIHQVANDYTEGDTTWNEEDYANFQVYAVKRSADPSLPEFNQVYFVLTSSNVSDSIEGVFEEVKSEIYDGVYEDQKWNFAVKFSPSRYPSVGLVSGSEIGPGNTESDFEVEFIGINTAAGVKQQSFHITKKIASSNGINVPIRSKRFYAGAHRQNFTGSLLNESDVRISSCRFWQLGLEQEEIVSHAMDPTNYGVFNPMQSAYLLQEPDVHLSMPDNPFPIDLPRVKTLLMNWDFETLSGSDSAELNGEFTVLDFSSGSAENPYAGTIANKLFERHHTGRAAFFPNENNYTGSISQQNVYGLVGQVPENLNSAEMIRVFGDYDKYFTTRTKPITFNFGIEKSMYQTISEQMIDFVAASIESTGMENLIGEAHERYRTKYKKLEKIREVFFRRVSRTPDIEKFINYYKWLDSSISEMVQHVVPASSRFRDVTDVIESHAFERPKYLNKVPLLNKKLNNDLANTPLEAPARGNNHLTYNWKRGHAPVSGQQTENLTWWENRAVRSDENLKTGVQSVDNNRVSIFSASAQVFDRKQDSTYKFAVSRGGANKNYDTQFRSEDSSNDLNYKQPVFINSPVGTFSGLSFDTSTFVSQSNVAEKDANNPNRKYKTSFKVSLPQSGLEVDGRIYSPLTFHSANMPTSILPGYQLSSQHHRDYYLSTKEVPMQGPFTEQNVGGYAHRHGGLHLQINSGPQSEVKPEAWYAFRTALANGEIQFTLFNPFDLGAAFGLLSTYPRATHSRDLIAKRPLNIKNIKSIKTLRLGQRTNLPPLDNISNTLVYNGNYSEDYQIVQIPGRDVNNRFLARSGSVPTASAPSIGTPSVSGAYDWQIPNRGSSKHIFVNIFSAPGGPEVNGSAFRDYQSDTFAVYNALPFRNLSVRNPLAELLKRHVLFSGYDSTFGSPSASFGSHKTQRNGRKYREHTDIFQTLGTKTVFDNYYVQHQIPQSDLQYSWITASAISYPFGYFQKDFSNRSFASTDLVFLSASLTGAHQENGSLVKVDFAGLNSVILNSVTSGSNLLEASVNTSLFPANSEISNELLLNSITLNRGGVYGFSNKNLQVLPYHPVLRDMIQNNRLSLLTQSVTISPGDLKQKKIVNNGFADFIEPPVSFKYKPLEHDLNLKTGKEIILKNSFANNLATFTDIKINNILNFYGNPLEDEIYSKMKKVYADKEVPKEYSPIESLDSLVYREVVYPRERNTGLARSRTRQNYTVSSGSDNFNRRLGDSTAFWKDKLEDRLRSDAVARNAEGLIIASGSSFFGLTDMSIWPLDSEEPFFDLYATNSYSSVPSLADSNYWAPLSPSGAYLSSEYVDRFADVNKNGELSYAGWIYSLLGINIQGKVRFDGQVTASAPLPNFIGDGDGERGLNFTPSCSIQYEYPNMMMSGNSTFSYFQPSASLHLIAPYRTDVLSGKRPWFNSYEEYSEDIRRIAKEYTVIPEFRISDHIDYYLKEGFFADNNKFLDLIGSSLPNTSSALSETGSLQPDFFKIYSHSDFMNHFGLIQKDHNKNNTAKVSKLRLEAKGIKKLLPYQGFYPVLRSVQLGQLFSASYAPFITGSNVRDGDQERLAALYQPFFSPGIFFNTIKSGIAVSYPVHTSSAPESVRAEGGVTPYNNPTEGASFISNQYATTPNYKFPFEAILDPDQFLPLSSSLTSSTENSLSSSVFFVYPNFTGSAKQVTSDHFYAAQTQDHSYNIYRGLPIFPDGVARQQPQIFFQWKGQSDPKYSLAASNFFAESVDFFLEKSALTSFISKPEKDFKSMVSGSTYYMDVLLYKTDDFVSYEGPPSGTFDGPGSYFLSRILDSTWNLLVNTFQTGDGLASPGISARGMHYGPSYQISPWPYGSTGTGSIPFAPYRAQDPTYAPHTPPYFYGTSRARIAFNPHKARDMVEGEAAKFTLEEILANAKVDTIYENENERALALQEDSYRNNFPAGIAQMQLSSSVNLFGQTTLKEVEYGTERNSDGTFKANRATTPVVQGTNDAWVIETKFECPSINLAHMDTASLGARSGDGKEKFHTRGIWKGYGHPPTGSEGIFLQLKESFPQKINDYEQGYGTNVTGSLLDVCGFQAAKERIGKIKTKKKISEAIVAVPIDEKGNFFPIDPKMFDKQKLNYETNGKALMAGDFGVEKDIGETSITDMIEKMKKFSLPPQMDFIKNRSVDPFVMYIFEFSHSLDKQDLADIWQNLMPKISTKAERATSVIEHSVGVNYEFFGQFKKGRLPNNIRWMVFKVKQKARNNFFNITQQSEVAKGFTFQAANELFGLSSNVEAELPYSYNWPYDFFSLVELAQVESSVTLEPPKDK